MRKLILTALVAVAATACTKTVDVFTPYAETDLRLPSVPLIVNDPYFSIWSPYDKLTDGTTRHWTNDQKPILGLLYVDGTPYRFLGAEQNYILSAIAPMSDEEAWEGKVSRFLRRQRLAHRKGCMGQRRRQHPQPLGTSGQRHLHPSRRHPQRC